MTPYPGSFYLLHLNQNDFRRLKVELTPSYPVRADSDVQYATKPDPLPSPYDALVCRLEEIVQSAYTDHVLPAEQHAMNIGDDPKLKHIRNFASSAPSSSISPTKRPASA